MSYEKSLDRIVTTVRRFNLNGMWLRDDEFYIDRNRVNKICEGMIKNRLDVHWYTSGTRVDIFNRATDEEVKLFKESGAYVLKFGAESGSNRMLELMQKGIRREDTIKANLKIKKYDIIPAYSFMIGFPTETFDDIHQTIDLAFKIKKDNPKAQLEAIGIYTPLPGTPLFDVAIKHGFNSPERLEDWIDWEFAEYDLKGRRIPWFSYSDRKKMGNISYMYTISNAVPNLIGSIRNKFLKYLLKIAISPFVRFYRFRVKHKHYVFAPELQFFRYLRNKIFYKSYFILK